MDDTGLGPLIGSGNAAEVFACGAHAAKLYRSPAAKAAAFREGAALAIARSFGLPVPAVHAVKAFGARWAVIMDRVAGPAFAAAAQAERTRTPDYLAAMVTLHRRIHAVAGGHFPGLKIRLGTNITAVGDALGATRRQRLLERLARLSDGDRLCHGDFHPWNIMGDIGSETVVDWLDATCGPPAADVCRSFVLIAPHEPELAAAYVEAYGRGAGVEPAAIFAWLPVTAAARLAENVSGETDALMAWADAV